MNCGNYRKIKEENESVYFQYYCVGKTRQHKAYLIKLFVNEWKVLYISISQRILINLSFI